MRGKGYSFIYELSIPKQNSIAGCGAAFNMIERESRIEGEKSGSRWI